MLRGSSHPIIDKTPGDVKALVAAGKDQVLAMTQPMRSLIDGCGQVLHVTGYGLIVVGPLGQPLQ